MTKTKSASPVVKQREPSIWMLLGALQSAFWFFALPPMLKPIWPSLFGAFPSPLAEVILWTSSFPLFLVYILVVALPPYLLQLDFFEQFKISKDPWPWRDERESVRKSFWRQARKTIFIEIIGLFVLLPVLVYLKTWLIPSRGVSFSLDDWPTYWEMLISNLSLAVIHEFAFFSTHRIMHYHPKLYKFHKVHHEYKQNNVLAAQHFHPVDFVLSIAGPAILTSALVRPHSFTQLQFGIWLLAANFDDHLGYNFPWSPVRWFPFSAGTDAHEFHHSFNMGCYGSKLSLWDWVFGTDKTYEEWSKKRWGAVD